MKKRILVTGGTGRFGSIFKRLKTEHKMFFPVKTTLDITNFKSIKKYIKFKKPNIVIHLAGLSRPMNIHDRQIQKSILELQMLLKHVQKKMLNLFIFLQIMSTPEQKVITKKRTVCYHSIIMHGRSLAENVLFKCIKIL